MSPGAVSGGQQARHGVDGLAGVGTGRARSDEPVAPAVAAGDGEKPRVDVHAGTADGLGEVLDVPASPTRRDERAGGARTAQLGCPVEDSPGSSHPTRRTSTPNRLGSRRATSTEVPLSTATTRLAPFVRP